MSIYVLLIVFLQRTLTNIGSKSPYLLWSIAMLTLQTPTSENIHFQNPCYKYFKLQGKATCRSSCWFHTSQATWVGWLVESIGKVAPEILRWATSRLKAYVH